MEYETHSRQETAAPFSSMRRKHRSRERSSDAASISGPGIPDEDKPKIFDLLYVGKKTQADSSRSLGLGLNLCKSILEAHGQTIRAEDTYPHGTTMIFTLKPAEDIYDETVSDPGC